MTRDMLSHIADMVDSVETTLDSVIDELTDGMRSTGEIGGEDLITIAAMMRVIAAARDAHEMATRASNSGADADGGADAAN